MEKSEKTHETKAKTGKMKKKLALAVETSGRNGSVAVGLKGEVLAAKNFSAPLRHSAEIFPTISEILLQVNQKAEDIGQVYISVGPGSFTGLRIAVTAAKMMHLANGVDIAGVDTLDVIAQNARECGEAFDKAAVVLDAKRKQFFMAVYEPVKCGFAKVMDDSLLTADEFRERFCGKGERVAVLGEGLVYHKEKFEGDGCFAVGEEYWSPRASNIIRLGWAKAKDGKFEDALSMEPKYIRRPEAEEQWEKRVS